MTTTFDPRKTAILSLHLVNDIVSAEGKFGPYFAEQVAARQVLANASRLLEQARTSRIPVIHVAVRFQPGHTDLVPNTPLLTMVRDMDALVADTWGAEFAEGVQPEDGEAVVTHQRVGAFHQSELDSILRDRGIEHLVLLGVVTNNIVEHCARNAVDRGYTLSVVETCCAAATPEAHTASIDTMGLLGQIISLDECLAAMA